MKDRLSQLLSLGNDDRAANLRLELQAVPTWESEGLFDILGQDGSESGVLGDARKDDAEDPKVLIPVSAGTIDVL